MAKLSARLPGKPILPFNPTADANGSPTTCRCCAMLAFGVGRIDPADRRRPPDPGFTCKPCILAAGDITKLDRVSLYEVKALESGAANLAAYYKEVGLSAPTVANDRNAVVAAMDAGGSWLADAGISDLSAMSEEQVEDFIKTVLAAGVAGFSGMEAHDDLFQLLAARAAWEGCARGVREALREAPF